MTNDVREVLVRREAVQQPRTARLLELFHTATLRRVDRSPRVDAGIAARTAAHAVGVAEHRLRVRIAHRPIPAGVGVFRAVLFGAGQDIVL